MPFEHYIVDGILHTVMRGRVSDDELLAYYAAAVQQSVPSPWRELVNGLDITDYAITPHGQRRLALFCAARIERLRGGRVAMVAASDITYGMFRMWELQRERLGYPVRVFREISAAINWLTTEDDSQ